MESAPSRPDEAAGQQFLLGVNYWPRRKAMRWWADFDRAEVRDEFSCIRELGLTHVRVFLLWESFQPELDRVSGGAVAHLREACDVAAELGLHVQVTFFTGHMSGPNWAPEWLIDRSRRASPGDRQLVGLTRPAGDTSPIQDIYANPIVVAAEDRLLQAVCGELRDHPAVWGWSLGNEPDLFGRPIDAPAGRRWVRDRVALIRSVDPERPVLIGLHSANLESDVGFRLGDIARETDVSVMHGYPFYSRHARRPLDTDFVPFTAALSAALADRPVLYEETGVNTHWPDGPSGWRELPTWGGGRRQIHFASEDDAAQYLESVLPGLVRVGSLGAFLWCFADYAPELWDQPPCDLQVHERFFGLVRPDGSLKPGADVVRRFAQGAPTVRPPGRVVDLGVSEDDYYADPEPHLRQLYETFGTLRG